jgi:hypothetical protein
MKQHVNKLSLIALFGFSSLALVAVGCGSSSSSSGTGGTSGGSGGTSGAGTPVVANPDGFVPLDMTNNPSGIEGAWFIYGDGISTGSTTGDCENKGMFPSSACSTVMTVPAPPAGTTTFPQDPAGTFCITGTAQTVMNGPTGGPSAGKPDYSDIFGIGMGLDFNNPGAPAMKAAFNMTDPAHHITTFSFDLSGVPTGAGALRVEFPTGPMPAGTDGDGFDSYYAVKAIKNGHFDVSMAHAGATGDTNSDLGLSFAAPTGMPAPVFDPSIVEGVQFHIVTGTAGPVTVTDFCVSNITVTLAQ